MNIYCRIDSIRIALKLSRLVPQLPQVGSFLSFAKKDRHILSDPEGGRNRWLNIESPGLSMGRLGSMGRLHHLWWRDDPRARGGDMVSRSSFMDLYGRKKELWNTLEWFSWNLYQYVYRMSWNHGGATNWFSLHRQIRHLGNDLGQPCEASNSREAMESGVLCILLFKSVFLFEIRKCRESIAKIM